MSMDGEPDPLEDWERAEEHGHAVGEYISEQDGYAHPEFAQRNSDGTFRRQRARPGDE